jgi:hypothetical protein
VLVYLAIAIVLGVLAFRWLHSWLDERREIARLRQPVDPSVGLTPVATNQAVLMYVYGFPRQDVPGDHRDAVTARFGMTAPLLLERVDDLLAQAALLRDRHGAGDALERHLGEQNPILTPAAAGALSAWASTRRA